MEKGGREIERERKGERKKKNREGYLLADLLERGERVGCNSFAIVEESVIVEPVLDWRTVAQAASEVALHGLAQNVRARVPEDL